MSLPLRSFIAKLDYPSTVTIENYVAGDSLVLEFLVRDRYGNPVDLTGAVAKWGIVAGTPFDAAYGAALLTKSNYSSVVTLTIANPSVVRWPTHKLLAGTPIIFANTGGAPPDGEVPGATYYVLAAGLTADNFEFSIVPGGTAQATSGSQSGVQSATAWGGISLTDAVNGKLHISLARGDFEQVGAFTHELEIALADATSYTVARGAFKTTAAVFVG